ncbi:penicillin-binding protein 1A [Parvularcula bermudensis]|nr:penicillin-binding protein 1A [Parvularcula bermudensis]
MLLLRIIGGLAAIGTVAAIAVVIGIFVWLQSLHVGLPSEQTLADYEPPVTTRVHAGTGELLAEFARERRLFVPDAAIPAVVKQAFISAEDKNFYDHGGLDYRGIARAALRFIPDKLQGNSLEGGSTITQQVAKNMLLTADQRFERKAKEAIVAQRMEKAFSKEHILELYLNEIYLGNRSYGVAAAALNYFGKPLSALEPHEAAYLATLAKAPANYRPTVYEDRAIARRNWILGRMHEDGYLTDEELETARAQPLGASLAPPLGAREDAGQYFAEEVRRRVADLYGSEALYDGGLSIRTTLDPEMQRMARLAFRMHLVEYDRRHGYRGPISTLALPNDLAERLPVEGEASSEAPFIWQVALEDEQTRLYKDRKAAADLDPWELAVVLSVADQSAEIGLLDGQRGRLPLDQLTWAREFGSIDSRGPQITRAGQVLSAGDVVYVEALSEAREDFALYQIPAVNGGLVAMDPHTGRVLAMVGGFSFDLSEFNRATQAWRQPGSTFKPFVYATALENGYTPSSIVLDAPFVAPSLGNSWWKPGNYVAGRFYGESTLRLGIEKSRNTMTARLAQDIGIGRIIDTAETFGVSERLPRELAISLGAGETTLMRITTAYAQFVNGGRRIEPILIDRVQNRYGETIYAWDQRSCFDCDAEAWTGQGEPVLADDREYVIDPRTAFQMVSILEGVIDRGTGARIKSQIDGDYPLAGKTGTTDDYHDAWFVGFSPDLAVGVYVGYDTPQSLGQGEGGSNVAAPIFGEFMARVLPKRDVVPFRAPSGIRLVRVNAKTGKPAQSGDPNVILEAFKAEDNVYGANRFATDSDPSLQGRADESISDDLGGIY